MPRLPDKSAFGDISYHTQFNVVPGSATGAGLPAQALEGAGQRIESAGNEIQQNTNHLETLQAEAQRVVDTQNLDQKFQQDNDYATFAPRAQASLQEINTNASNLISNPNARAMFQARATAEGQRVYHEILARGTNLSRQDAFDKLQNTAGKIALGIKSAPTPDEAVRRADELENAIRTFDPNHIDPNHQRRTIDKYIRGQSGIINQMTRDRAYDIAGKGFQAQWDNLKELDEAASRGAAGSVPQSAGDYLQGRLAPGYESRTSDVQNLHPVMQDRLAAFLKAGQDAGHDISIVSGQRSEARQAVLWQQALQKYGSPQEAAKHVAPPGGSTHQTGEATDLQFGDRGPGLGGETTSAVKWAHAHAGEYGLNFPLGNEDWHIEPTEARAGGKRYGGKYDPNGPKYWRGADSGQPGAPTKVAANDNATGGTAPQSLRWADLFARMTPEALAHARTNARTALHQSVLTEADGAEKIAESTGQIPKDNDGQTVLDHSRVLLPNQQTKVQYKVEGGLHRYKAVAPLADMDDAQFAQHYQALDPANQKMSDGKTPLPYAIAAKNQAYAAQVYAKIQGQRRGKNADVAQATMGAPLSVGKSPRISDVGENGQPIITDVDGGDLTTHASSEVTDAMRYIGGRFGDINAPDTDPAVKQKAWGLIFDARLATQRRWGIPERNQNIMTLDEARKLLKVDDFADQPKSEIKGILQEAAKTAQERYGVRGRRALVDAIKVVHGRQKAENEGFDLGAGLLSGEIKPEDLDLGSRLIGRQDPGTILERGQRGRDSYAPTMPTPEPQPATAAPRLRPGMPPPRSGSFAPTSGVAPADVVPTPPSSGAIAPSEGRANWLRNSLEGAKTEVERREIRRAFNTFHRDPGAARREEERARQFFDQQDRSRS